MTESLCPTCGRPEGAGHEPQCFEPVAIVLLHGVPVTTARWGYCGICGCVLAEDVENPESYECSNPFCLTRNAQ